jgi:hypothetical protein
MADLVVIGYPDKATAEAAFVGTSLSNDVEAVIQKALDAHDGSGAQMPAGGQPA